MRYRFALLAIIVAVFVLITLPATIKDGPTGLFVVLGISLAYFLPTIVSFLRHARTGKVAVLNTFLGWTGVGWVISLMMAVG